MVDNGTPLAHLTKLTELLPSGKFLSIETLLDCLMVLYDECCNSSLRREKTVSDFIELSEYFIHSIFGLDIFGHIDSLLFQLKILSSRSNNCVSHAMTLRC